MANTYFTVAEFCTSSTAKAKGIKNEPNEQQIKNIHETIDAITPLRIAWGAHVKTKGTGLQGFNVNSGFRSLELNKAVGGVATSGHLEGWCVDLWPSNGDWNDFLEFVQNWVANAVKNGFAYDQIIIEKDSNGSVWLHFGLKNLQGLQRMQLFSATKA